MKILFSAPNGNQQYLYSSTGNIQYIHYDIGQLVINVDCAGTTLGTAYQLPSYKAADASPTAFQTLVLARYVDSSNLAIILPNQAVGSGFYPGPTIDVCAYWYGSGMSGPVSIVIYLPMIGGVQSQFHDGSISLSVPVGESRRFVRIGQSLSDPFPPLWTHS